MTTLKKKLTFAGLVDSIKGVDLQLARQAGKAVNISLTLRNWLIGMYIAEYELRGAGRAGYGENLFNELAAKLAQHNVSGCRFRQLYNYRAYPQISRTVSTKSKELFRTIVRPAEKLRTASAQLTIDPAKSEVTE
jgi:hypothetical protein